MNELTISTIDDEPRVHDLLLAERLGYAHPKDIRKLIRRHLPALEQMAPLATVARVINGGEATEFYLNRAQAVFIIAKSDTERATELTIQVVEKFIAYESGRIAVPQLPDFTNPAIAARAWALEWEQRQVAEQKLIEAQPKIAFVDSYVDTDGTFNPTAVAKMIGLRSAKKLHKLAHQDGIIIKSDRSGWLPAACVTDEGWFKVVTNHKQGEIAWTQMLRTTKGLVEAIRRWGGA